MHCPTCGQQQVSDQTRFCSRCGFPLAGVADLIANNGIVTEQKPGFFGTADSPRRRGFKQGVFIFLMTALVVPILALISLFLNIEPFLPAIAAMLFGIGGFLRTVYALMFEPAVGGGNLVMPQTANLPAAENRGALPPGYAAPASSYGAPNAGSWRDTNELQNRPGSVTDSTTKLLQKEEDR